MYKLCLYCSIAFKRFHKRDKFCSSNCRDHYRNDRKPRKTDKSYKLATLKRKQRIPQKELEIIYGCLLGDGSLALQTNGFHRMSICHCIKQYDYLEWKRKILQSIFICNSPKGNDVQVSIHSIAHKDLTNIYGILYPRKKKTITRKFLNLLTPTSLLFWFLDDGSLMRASGNSFILYTCSFSLSENRAIIYWFWQSFKIKAFIYETKGSFSDKIYYGLRFRKKDSISLFNIFRTSKFFNDLPDCMKYKFYSYF